MKLMTEFMEENPDLAKSFSANSLNSRESQRMLWERLDSIWTTRKYSAKKKLITNKKSIAQTDGGPFSEIPLDTNEEAIVQVCGMEAAVAGISGVSSFGCDEQILETEINNLIGEPVETALEQTPTPVRTNTKKNPPQEDENIVLLRKQVELQEKFISMQADIGKSLNEVTVSIRELKDCVALLCQEKERHSSNALKREELQLKRMELELAKAVNKMRMLELTK